MQFLKLFTFCSAISLCAANVVADDNVRISEETVIRFASVEEAKPIMTARDSFINGLSRFDLECRLRTTEQVSVDLLLAHIPTQLLDWTAEDKQTLIPILEQVRTRLEGWSLPFPETVMLIKTTGREDAGAAYCRGNAIVLPQAMLARASESLFLHELFHILSRQDENLRSEMYSVVGFTIGNEVELPESLRDIKITNPDAPLINCFIELEHQGSTITATPLLTASANHFDPQPGKTLFNYLQFHLLVVDRDGDQWRVKLGDDGKPMLLEPNGVPSFFEKIGRNTTYIIHPEEVLADNFVLLLRRDREPPSPEILARLREKLERQ